MAGAASGVNKTLVLSKESVWGTKPAAGTGKLYRRVTCDLSLSREQFQSAEIVSTAQTSDARSGTDNVEGTLSAELSPGSYTDLWAALLRGPWVAGVTSGALTTVASSSVGNTFTRSAGSWLTDGFKAGDTIAVSGFAAPATANNKSYTILSVTATVITVNSIVVTKAAGDSVTTVVSGKKLVIPFAAGDRTDDSFTVEQEYTDIGVSRLATGVKITTASVSVEPDSIATVEFGMMGKDMVSSGTAYFTTPAAPSLTGVMTGNSGSLYADGVQLASVTSFSFELTANAEIGKIIGNLQPDNTRPASDIFLGRVTVSGELSAYFENDDLFTKFRDEEAVSVVFRFDGENGASMTFKMPRVKLGNASVDDAEVGGLKQSIPFVALLSSGTDASLEMSTLVIQDSTI